ncbi:MAG: hypothetical protein GWO24_24085 [Akkermansiaceae bacterium]|nr:hypothetical protein [Akkermansiaceae bacterium]
MKACGTIRGGYVAGVAALLLAAGCASPAARVKKHHDVFQTFPKTVQEQVRQGKIQLGYTEQMVHIAKGPPDRKYERHASKGTTLVWSYTDITADTERQRVQGRYHFTDTTGRTRTTTEAVWADIQHRREYEVMRVEFADGKVIAIEHLKR